MVEFATSLSALQGIASAQMCAHEGATGCVLDTHGHFALFPLLHVSKLKEGWKG